MVSRQDWEVVNTFHTSLYTYKKFIQIEKVIIDRHITVDEIIWIEVAFWCSVHPITHIEIGICILFIVDAIDVVYHGDLKCLREEGATLYRWSVYTLYLHEKITNTKCMTLICGDLLLFVKKARSDDDAARDRSRKVAKFIAESNTFHIKTKARQKQLKWSSVKVLLPFKIRLWFRRFKNVA